MLSLTTSIQLHTGSWVHAVQLKVNKRIRRKTELSVAENVIMYAENSVVATDKWFEIIREVNNFPWYNRSIYKNQFFLFTNTEEFISMLH